jgi:hypothetical protein
MKVGFGGGFARDYSTGRETEQEFKQEGRFMHISLQFCIWVWVNT